MFSVPKAYENQEFLTSSTARNIRVLCEYEEPKQRFMTHSVRNTIVFFGSARTLPTEEAQNRVLLAQEYLAMHPLEPTAKTHLEQASRALYLSQYYEQARELARRLTEWSLSKAGYHYYICSGGGPGIMEAANRGASEVPGGKSIGLGISLPMEQSLNPWVTPELAFEFHYFFTRKYWFLCLCKALVIFPGGFGTLDELFETLTLVQTKKMRGRLPLVLFGTDYWDKVLNLEAMRDFGMIGAADIDLIYRTNSLDAAFAHITGLLLECEDPETDKILPSI